MATARELFMRAGYSDVLVGLQYGDEGKARVIDTLASGYDVIARFNGGSNAGHTVEAKGKRVALHQVPSGIFYKDKILYIGSGCVVNPARLVAEIEEIEAMGVSLDRRLHISSHASLVQPHHVALDKLTGGALGTTGQGIGPVYADRALRLKDIQVGRLVSNSDGVFDAVKKNIHESLDDNVKKFSFRDVIASFDPVLVETFEDAAAKIVQYVEPDPLFLTKLVKDKGKRVLFEGAQSVMLDVVKGSVPFVTSSSTVAGAAYVGGDLPPKFHRKTIGVAKVIMSRVGSGPFPSEFGGARSETYCRDATKADEMKRDADVLIASEDPLEVGIALRKIGGEYGATTLRPRRIGAFDLVQLTRTVEANGVDVVYLNKCDLLRDYSRTLLGTMPLVTGYSPKGVKTEQLPCFKEDISSIRSASALPVELTRFLTRIERTTHSPIGGIGVGPRREQFVPMNG
jgi:adenylosuccinate synthase